MASPKRDILVVMRDEFVSDKAIEQEVEYLNEILRNTETFEEFCRATELVRRNKITSRTKRIEKAILYTRLPAFWFLINKN